MATKDTINITEQELKNAGFDFSPSIKYLKAETIQCKGAISLPKKNKATISAQFEGIITKLYVNDGQFVEKGQVLAILQNDAIIDLEKEFIEISSHFDFSKHEFTRQGEQALDNSLPIKEAQLAEVDYKVMEARYYTLKEKLRILGINTEKLKPESIKGDINIYSPLKGSISKINVKIGKYVTKGEKLFKVIDISEPQMKLKLHERKFNQIHLGQKTTFTLASDCNNSFQATFENIGKKVNSHDSTINVYAKINSKIGSVVDGMSLSATIPDTVEKFIIPFEATFRIDNNYYLLLFKPNILSKIQITAGTEKNAWIILNPNGQLISSKIVTFTKKTL
jgi:cobalt-zinc-cadmium efflux system membrane fusion protein